MADGSPSAVDELLVEEHSGGTGGDESASDLALDDFQAKEIRQIFLTTLPEYLEPVSQMLEQVLASTDGQEEVRRALQTTLSSISVAAARVGVEDVCSAVDMIRDQLLALDDEPAKPRKELRQNLRDALLALETIAGRAHDRPESSKQTIVAALMHVDNIDKSALERMTAAGLVTVDQLRIAKPAEVMAVTGLSSAVVHQILELLVPKAADPAREVAATADVAFEQMLEAASVPKELGSKLRAQVDIEASLDELRAEILRARLRIDASKKRVAAAENRRDRLQTELEAARARLTERMNRLTAARIHRAKVERECSEQNQAFEQASRRLAAVQQEDRIIAAERERLAGAVSEVVARLAHLKRAVPLDDFEDGMGSQDP